MHYCPSFFMCVLGTPVIPALWKIKAGRSLGLAGCQLSSKANERPCLKRIRRRVMEQDTQHPSVASACVCTHEHTDTHKKETNENWLEASVIQWLLSIIKGFYVQDHIK